MGSLSSLYAVVVNDDADSHPGAASRHDFSRCPTSAATARQRRHDDNDRPAAIANPGLPGIAAHGRHQVRITPIGTKQLLQTGTHLVLRHGHRRQAQGGDESPDQPRAGQVHTFREHPAQHGKADALALRAETCQKFLPCAGPHAPVLTPLRDVRALRNQLASRLLQVVKAAEEGQVVAGVRVELPCDDVQQALQ